jgi:NTP pyrophosphatase (non-canonical NTP hydrolase)
MDELITKVEQWAKDKGLDQADPKVQFLKVAEEFGEIASAMARSNDELFKDSVGDVIVTLIILSMQKGTNVQECLEMAYNEIKGRTGKMVDGVFVKSSDLEDSDESKITDEQAWNKVAEAYPESAQSLRNTLDNAVFGKTGEHQKPVVPQFVADWFEEHKGESLENNLFYEIVYLFSEPDKDFTDFQGWLYDNSSKYLSIIISMKDGYEVEKESLYYVVFDILQEQKFLVKNIKTKLFYLSNNENVIGNYEQVSFTEQEIKAIDERYWAFAVPVKEVKG